MILSDAEISRLGVKARSLGYDHAAFARLIEETICKRLMGRIAHTEEAGEVCTADCDGCDIVKQLGIG